MLPPRFLFLSLAALGLTSARIARRQDNCPEVPDTGVTIGEPVPMIPEHIPQGCSDFEILVGERTSQASRGTSEPNADGGKFGVIVGDPVVSNTSAILAGARGYPVQYPASARIITGVRQGSADVVSRLTSQAAACPQQTFALVGYSQGAAVMHAAADDIPRALYGRIKSLVMFGDGALRLGSIGSRFPIGLNNKVMQVCADGDPTCDRDGTCTYYHLTYIRHEYVDPAVNHIVQGFLSG
ncbi:alpha/beta-hydrolase [Sodiomyces alkalinus F11]|uniref:Alpha/beta-hydrolase n=1 Tax=Sodiomyces alkalinus (strain CBS 110278 / VKM F-3762 / F11) TaxID=1314773 RepID=A0A3N2PP07_SODAK|nr:alpha/beta-hydrolase [Sodiomyces alkalinus F11]ROT36170.1 alpha/beta-hydrolase [Sodiomyces alkalinus F11]